MADKTERYESVKKGTLKSANQIQRNYTRTKKKIQVGTIYNWMAVIGLIVAFGAVGRSDMSRFEPLSGVIIQTLIGFALMLPKYIREFKRRRG